MSANMLWREDAGFGFGNLPDYTEGNSDNVLYNCNNGCGLKVFYNASPCHIDDYIKTLENRGYRVHTDRTVRGNRFVILEKENTLVHITYLQAYNEVRLLFEPDADILPKDRQQFHKNTESALHGLSLDQTNIDCGMSYILKAADGSYFIIDGGFFTPREDEKLFRYLQNLTPDGEEIIINGWFFSHVHQDHVGCFMEMTKHYHGKFKVEAFYYNFPSIGLPEAKNWRAEDTVTTIEFYELMEQYYGDVPHYKTCTGQIFSVRNMDFEVLVSHEVVYPNKIHNNNDASTVIAVTVEGQRILFLGDAGTEESRYIIDLYGDSLKSDMVQVAHHGFNGAEREIYVLADAEVVLWPTADYRLVGDLWRPANHFLAYERRADHFISGFGDWNFPLPYTVGSVKDSSEHFPDESEIPNRK